VSHWTTPAERRRILAAHRSRTPISRLATDWGYSRSGIYGILDRARRDERADQRADRFTRARSDSDRREARAREPLLCRLLASL